MTKLVRRPYREHTKRTPLPDKCGHLTPVRHAGFLGNMAAWLFRCDCGAEIVRRAPHIAFAVRHNNGRYELSCGQCQYSSRRPKHGESRTKDYSYWASLKRKRVPMAEGWNDYVTFRDQCLAYKRDGDRYLLPLVTNRPLGPDNFYWDTVTAAFYATINKCVEVLISRGASEDEAHARACNMSRQRRSQIIAQAAGLCPTCFKKREPELRGECRRCLDKHNKLAKLSRNYCSPIR